MERLVEFIRVGNERYVARIIDGHLVVGASGGAVIVDAFVDNTIEAFGQAVGLAFGGAAGARRC